MNEFELSAERRADVGKGASRRLRRDGKVPAIVYGGDEEPMPVTLIQNEMNRRLENQAFYSHVLTLKLGSETQSVVLKDIHRHPYKRQLLHVDLQRVSASRRLHMRVPLHFLNEDACAGRKAGGVIHRLATEVEVGCLPKDLPEFIAVDLAGVELGQGVRLSELVLPAGVELSHPVSEETDRPVVMVARPHGGEEAPAAEAAAATPTAAP
jgi:large subunit ribosomal protein L25